jgi:MOSC domain-containing protein YiiM
MMQGQVVSVSRHSAHAFSKTVVPEIRLVTGLGVDGDAHEGTTVQHRSRVAVDPSQPNLRQVHLIHQELFGELSGKGFGVGAGDLGENIVTAGIDLLQLPTDALLHIGSEVVVQVTGLRNPCRQIDRFQRGLMGALVDRDEQGQVIRKAGIMSVVIAGGIVKPGDRVMVTPPALPHRPLGPV